MSDDRTKPEPVVQLQDVGLSFGSTRALDGITLDIPAGVMVGLIGPDGVGKSTLLSLIAGARVIQDGQVTVLGGDIGQKAHRDQVGPLIAYMPQGLGKNLYPMLSVEENLQFFARLFGHDAAERRRRIDYLTKSTGLHPFLDRPAGKLSGGMKQKLGLCSALSPDPRPGTPDSGRTHHRRRSPGPSPVLGPDQAGPPRSAGHERHGGHRLYGRGRAL